MKVTCATAVAVSNDSQGSMIAVAVQEVIYVWMAASGKMVTVIDSGKPSTYYTHVSIKYYCDMEHSFAFSLKLATQLVWLQTDL